MQQIIVIIYYPAQLAYISKYFKKLTYVEMYLICETVAIFSNLFLQWKRVRGKLLLFMWSRLLVGNCSCLYNFNTKKHMYPMSVYNWLHSANAIEILFSQVLTFQILVHLELRFSKIEIFLHFVLLKTAKNNKIYYIDTNISQFME